MEIGRWAETSSSDPATNPRFPHHPKSSASQTGTVSVSKNMEERGSSQKSVVIHDAHLFSRCSTPFAQWVSSHVFLFSHALEAELQVRLRKMEADAAAHEETQAHGNKPKPVA